jgi:hypothetical protein
MYCKYCGHKIDDDSTYCAGCGVKLNVAISPQNSTSVPAFGVRETSAYTPNPAIAVQAVTRPSVGLFDSIEDYEPTFRNMLSQFSPLGKVAFILLNLLVLSVTAVLTLFTFYPNATDLFK